MQASKTEFSQKSDHRRGLARHPTGQTVSSGAVPHTECRRTDPALSSFAEFYRDLQFSQAELPPLPDRAALYDAAPLPEADFSAEELRRAKKKMKKKRASGSDTLSVEFVLWGCVC